ncbi:HAUS augmin-like complex subunit 7 isoform X2 [Pseudoliparis swirei]|uniref:HAUS augmin-like complex subunit 7 isoform X2 n=1 Tax=Pseudoliparis swirei TaxID=2059687 RepID=UPI0024BE21C4|nr:HAUS augmin-like complex subunit 7 isoform X2 [Pseudoliparis swirei]
MAGALKEKQLVRHVYAALQAACCPLVDGLYLQDADSQLQLLCARSQHRTDILAWICSSIDPHFATSKATGGRSSGPDVLTREMAVLGQELMLCRADDLDLIRGGASPRRQLGFLLQLLASVPGGQTSAGKILDQQKILDQEKILNELFAEKNLALLSQMLGPSLEPWPADVQAPRQGRKSSLKPRREEAAGAGALQLAGAELQQLQSQCVFLSSEALGPALFSPGALRVAACDLQLLMAAFSRVVETDLRALCGREPPSCSAEAHVFQRTRRLLLACITELEVLRGVSGASKSTNEEETQLQTQKLPDRLEELVRRVGDFVPLLVSQGPKNPPV